MSDWKEYKLGDEATFIDYRGKTPNKKTFGVPLITAKIVKNGTIQEPTEFISKEDYPIWMSRGFPKVGDVVMTTEAPLGEVAQIKDASFALAQRIITIRGKHNVINNGYLKYFLQSDKGQSRLKERETGTTVTGIKSSELKQVLISAPDLPTQTAIAEILSSLDDKIELNNQINKDLETLAQTLFKQWFIDFEFPNENGEPYRSSGGEMVDSELGEIPKGWSVKSIKELDLYISDLVANGSFASIKENVKTSEYQDYALFIRNTDLKNRFKSQKIFVNEQSFNFLKKTMLFGGEIILPNVGDVGSVHKCPCFEFPMTLGNNCIMVKSQSMQSWLYTFFKSNIGFNALRSVVVGSVQDKLSKTNFKSIKLVLPTKDQLNIMEDLFSTIYDLQENNFKESDDFEKLRDTLLPKLISGELEVSDIQINTL